MVESMPRTDSSYSGPSKSPKTLLNSPERTENMSSDITSSEDILVSVMAQGFEVIEQLVALRRDHERHGPVPNVITPCVPNMAISFTQSSSLRL